MVTGFEEFCLAPKGGGAAANDAALRAGRNARRRGALYSVCPIAFFTRATSSGEAEASLSASAWG